MLVVGKIIAIDRRIHKEKTVVDMITKLDYPNEAITTTFWSASVEKGEHLPFERLVGESVFLGLRPEVFNGKLQYSVNTSCLPVSVLDYAQQTLAKHKPAAKAVGGN